MDEIFARWLPTNFTPSIYHSPYPSTLTPVILYLPRGLIAQSDLPEPHDLSSLALGSNATVVRVNYRLNGNHRYPIPIHDVMAGYDWVVKNLVEAASAHNGRQIPRRSGSIGVCGELFGGTMAAMLALTECHARRLGVNAAVLGNPVTDWTAMYSVRASIADTNEAGPVEKKRTSIKAPAKLGSWHTFANSSPISSAAILSARSAVFAKPVHYFDPFVSPLLFFRTASSDIPVNLTPDDLNLNISSNDIVLLDFIKKRRAHKRHPPLGSGLRLPRMNVLVGNQCVLKDQGVELAEMGRKSVRVHELCGFDEYHTEESRQAAAVARIEITEQPGVGLWDEKTVAEIGQWFGRTFQVERPGPRHP
jgi:acetyl esterase/lipase